MKTKSIAAMILMLLSTTILGQEAGQFDALPAEEIDTAMRNCQSHEWTNAPLRDAIAKAISFSASSQTVARVSEQLMTHTNGDRQMEIFESLGTNNLSFFLMTTTGQNLARYEIEQDVALFAFVAAQRSLSGRSPVLLEDIVEHNILTSTPEEITGHFVIEIPTSSRVRCVYVARQKGDFWVVQRLALARKNSLKIEDGLDVIKEDAIKKAIHDT